MRTAIYFSLMAVMAGTALAVPAHAGPKPKKAKDPNEVVCEKQEVLGSRLATRRVCMTRAQWAEQRRSDRDMVQRTQVGVYQKNP